MKILKFIKDHILNILFPRVCHHCERDLPASYKLPLCGECRANLKEPGPLICGRCGVSLPDGGSRCYSCRGSKAGGFKCSLIRSALVFTPEARSLVHKFKYNGHIYLQDFLLGKMSGVFDKIPEFKKVDVICPVPLHAFKQMSRGYNQSALLARALAYDKNIFYDEKLLVRKKHTFAQAKLKKADRIKNVENAFECFSADVKGKIVLIVDDVSTTGSTLEACAVALKSAKVKKVYALTLSREE